MENTALGTHCILDLFGCDHDILNDVDFVRDALEQATQRSGSTLLKTASHQFQPQGVTALALVAESHVAIHTWPEHGYAAVDIFTCGTDATPLAACGYLVERFAASRHEVISMARGTGRLRVPELGEADSCRTPD